MYPSSALSTGSLIAIAFTVVAAMAVWLGAVYYAAREPGTGSQRPNDER